MPAPDRFWLISTWTNDTAGRVHLAARIAIAQAKARHLATGQMAVEVEGLERQFAEAPGEVGLGRVDHLGLVAKAGRGRIGSAKQVRLPWRREGGSGVPGRR